MGSQQFQREYIEHLQKKNTELVNRLNHMKECYENKILSKNLNKHYLTSMLEEVLHVCTVLPQEIDIFFDKMTAAMGAVKDLLLRKSEMVQLVENISKVLHSDNPNAEYMTMQDSDLADKQLSECSVRKKAGTVKVSPMINGHIISTAPRIYLNRMPESEERAEIHRLSPIIEASPDRSSDTSNAGMQNFKEIKIPLVRVNLNDLMSYDFLSEESPKTRFKGPKSWRKKLSPNKYNQGKRNSPVLEGDENLIKKFSAEENAYCKQQSSELLDPLEGPSWLYEENSDINSSPGRLIDFRRRKHRFATVFDKDMDCCNYFEKKKKSINDNPTEIYENQTERNDDEDVEEIKRRISDNSDEFICESFSREFSEKYSLQKLGNKKRKPTKCLIDKNDSAEFEEDSKKKLSSSYLKVIHSDSSDGEDNSKTSGQKLLRGKKSFRKNSSKLSCCRISDELWSSAEKTPRRSRFEEHEIQVIRMSKNSKDNETLIKDALKKEVFIKLEDCLASNTSSANTSGTRSPSDITKFKRSKSKSKSKTPVFVSPKREGRIRRKAAPQKLVEPRLNSKLRRE